MVTRRRKPAILHSGRLFYLANGIGLGVVALAMVLPLLHVITQSLSSNEALMSGSVWLLPRQAQFESYRYVLSGSRYVRSFLVSVYLTVSGTASSMVMTTLAAYPLSVKKLRGRRVYLQLFIIAMVFYGGMVPSYILVKSLGLLDSLWAVICPHLIVPFNMLVMKTYFEGLPASLPESAEMDGASHFRILVSLVLPLSTAAIAVIGLFYAVTYWNNYFHAMLYISDAAKRTLQVYLYELVRYSDSGAADMDQALQVVGLSIKATAIVVSTVPILLVYPFLQKHFAKGVMIGAVKG